MSVPDPRQLHDDITTQVHSHIASPDAVHEQIVKSIRDMVAQMIDERVPKMASVHGQDGGKLLVQMDDEDEPRQVGFAKKNGQRYNNGDRVVVMPTGSGDHVVLGTVNAAQGQQEQAVGNPDLIDQSVNQDKIANGAVKRQHISPNAVGGTELAGDSVDTGHLKSNSVTNDKIASGAVDTSQLKSNSVNSDKIASGAVDTSQLANGSVNSSKIANGAVDTGQLANGSVTSDKLANNAMPDTSKLAAKSDVNNQLDKLSGKTIKPNKDGSITLPNLSHV